MAGWTDNASCDVIIAGASTREWKLLLLQLPQPSIDATPDGLTSALIFRSSIAPQCCSRLRAALVLVTKS